MIKSLLGIAAFLVSSLAFAQAAFDLSKVKISEFKYSGTGCPAGSVASDISEDRQAMTLIFDQFSAETSGTTGARVEINKKSCHVNLKLETPVGWSFTLFYLDFRGFAALDAGATGFQQTEYRLGSGREVDLGKFRLTGPYSDNYARIENLGLSSLPWSSCSKRKQSLTIESTVGIRSEAGAAGYMTIDSLDGEITHSYGIAWKRCNMFQKSVRTQFAAQCKTAIVNKADGTIFKDIITLTKGSDKSATLAAAKRKIRAKCDQQLRKNNEGEKYMCSGDAPACSVSAL
jgi:hypothetical protein